MIFLGKIRHCLKIYSFFIIFFKERIKKLKLKILHKTKTWTKFITTLLIVLAIIMFFSSCSLTNKAESVEGETKETIAEESNKGQQEEGVSEAVEIDVWDSTDPAVQIVLMDSIEQFLPLNLGLKISTRHFRSEEELLDQFEAASLAGAGPEILISRLQSASRLAKSKTIKQLTNEFDYSDILDGLNEISVFNGINYAIPFRAYNFLMLYYNKDLTTDTPVNFSDLITYCKEVRKQNDGNQGFLLNAKEPDWIIPFIGGYQDWIYDYSTGAISLNTGAMKKTLEFLLYIYNQEKILPYDIDYEYINSSFKNRKIHMIIDGNWAINEYIEAGINFGVTKIPVVLGGYKNPTPMLDGIGFMINSNCYGEKLIACKELINYLMSSEVQAKWTSSTLTLPAIKDIEQSQLLKDKDIWLAAASQAEICRGKPPDEFLRVIRDSIRINLENVIKGNIAVDEAVIKMQEDALKLKSGEISVEGLSMEMPES